MHDAIKTSIDKTDENLSTFITSYLPGRTAVVFDPKFPKEQPQLKYLKGRSTPQGSKLSPSIFTYNSGLIIKWFRDLFSNSKANNIHCDTIVYADDAAIFVSCKTLTKLESKIPKIVNSFIKIANYYGADLEMSKTEILISKRLSKTLKSI